VTGYLLDTNVALIALKDPDRLTAAAREAILTGPNVLSVATYWEVVIKAVKGKLHVGEPTAWWKQTLEDLVAAALPVRAPHVAEVYNLPPHHWDPFDRILIAQATVEGLVLVTTDEIIPAYQCSRLCVVL